MAIKSGRVQAASMCYSVYGASDDYSKIHANISLIQGLTVAFISTLIGVIYDLTGNYDPILYLCVFLYAASIVLSFLLDKMMKKI